MKVTFRGAAGLAATISALAALSACGSSNDGGATASSGTPAKATNSADCSAAGKKIVYVSVLRENPILRTMAQGFVDGAKKDGFEDPQWLAPQGFDEAGAAQLGQQAIAQGTAGIVVFASSPAFYPMIRRAQAAHIPVVQTHSIIPEGKAPGVDAVLAPDPKQYGAAAAEAIGAKLGGKGTVAITQTAFQPNENDAATAFTDTMKAKYPTIKVLKPQLEGSDVAKAIGIESAIIQAHPDLSAAFSTNGNGPVTWSGAQRDTKHKLVIIGMDYAKANLDLVKSGEVYGIVAQPIYQEHAKAADVMKQIICGQKVPYMQTMPAPVVTKAGLDEYYNFLDRVKIR